VPHFAHHGEVHCVAYGHGLADKPEVVALSQADLLDDEERAEKLADLKKASGKTPLLLSSATGEGTEAVLRALMQVVEEARQEEQAAETVVGDQRRRGTQA
jgi:GTP-binding protein